MQNTRIQKKNIPTTNEHVLLIEDTMSLSLIYQSALEEQGYIVNAASNGESALEALIDSKQHFNIVLLDLKLPDAHGLDMLDTISRHQPHADVIIITSHGSVNMAVEAMRRGAKDFLVKPFDTKRMIGAIERLKTEEHAKAKTVKPPQATQTMTADLAGLYEFTPQTEQTEQNDTSLSPRHLNKSCTLPYGFIGTSPVMQNIYNQIEAAAKSDATVFISGESGTGKELCAKAIHQLGHRKAKNFIPINCAAIPRDLIESELFGHIKGAFTGAIADREGAVKVADGGTLFLDEIAEMAPDMQTKLLRFLQDMRFCRIGDNKMQRADVRIICATNRDALAEIDRGQFREDLFYRLHVLPIHMPPLRDRSDDILDLAEVFLLQYAEQEKKTQKKFSPDAEKRLKDYHWPGNIRQLQNIIRHIVVMNNSQTVKAGMLPDHMLHNEQRKPSPTDVVRAVIDDKSDPGAVLTLQEMEKLIIEDAIEIHNQNIPQAAAALGISPSTIYRKKAEWDQSNQKTT